MSAICYTRYGACEAIDATNIEKVMSDLLNELREEMFDEPDDEYTQVSIGNEHWVVTAQVSGLITFDNLDLLEGLPSDLPENLYLRDVSDESLKAIWRATAESNRQVLMSYPWKALDQLPSFAQDYYRSLR